MVCIMQDAQSNVLLDSDIPFCLITGIYKGIKYTSFIYIYIYVYTYILLGCVIVTWTSYPKI